MAWQLMREVLDHAPASTTSGERLVLLAIAEYARRDTRRWTGPQEEIARRAGMTTDGVRRVLGKLSGRGLDARVPLMLDQHQAPVYAVPGRAPTFRVPRLAPADCSCASCASMEPVSKAGPAARLADEGGTTVPAAGTDGTPRRDAGAGQPGRASHPHRPKRNEPFARGGGRDAGDGRRAAVAACGRCSPEGWLLGEDGLELDPAEHCTHPDATDVWRVARTKAS